MGSAVDEKETKPPQRYTQGSIRWLMEKHCLGTEATRSSIIETLEDRGYIMTHKNQVIATTKGELLVYAIGQDSVLTDVQTTQKWEEYLTKVGSGERQATPFIEQTKKLTRQLVTIATADSSNWDIKRFEKAQEEAEAVGNCPLYGGTLKDIKANHQHLLDVAALMRDVNLRCHDMLLVRS